MFIIHTSSSPECDPEDIRAKQSHHITFFFVKEAFIAMCIVIYFFH